MKTRQNYLSSTWGEVVFIDSDENNYNHVCQPKNITILSTEAVCNHEKQLKTLICVSIREGQGIGEKGLYVNLIY